MKKTLVAIAALAAFGAQAQSFVNLTGRASMDVSTFQAIGSTNTPATNDFANRTRVADTSSRITFAAQEDLGGGMKAGVYCETGINIDNATNLGQAGSNNANTSEFCSREGRLYYGNNTAEIRLGRQNVWWTQGALNEVGSTYLGADSFTNLQNGGVGVYTVRGENMIKLFGGAGLGAFAGSELYTAAMSGSGGNAAAATTSATGEAAAPGAAPNGKYFGGKLQYTAGQVVGMIDYQNSSNAPAAAATQAASNAYAFGADKFSRKSIKYGVGYKYAENSLVSFQYWEKSRTDKTTAGATFVSPFVSTFASAQTTAGDAKDSGYGIVVKHDLGAGLTFHGQYGKANNLKNGAGTEVADSGATAYTLGFTQALSKRTHVYTAYHVINNQAAAGYNMSGGNYSSASSVAQGADIKMFALGMIHNF